MVATEKELLPLLLSTSVRSEWWLARKDFAFIRSSLADDGLASDVVEEFIDALRPPGALRAALNWYRASFRDGARKRLRPKKVAPSTLVIWGEAERHLDRDLSVPTTDWVQTTSTTYVAGASHWVHHDAPARVNELLVEHFAEDGVFAMLVRDHGGPSG